MKKYAYAFILSLCLCLWSTASFAQSNSCPGAKPNSQTSGVGSLLGGLGGGLIAGGMSRMGLNPDAGFKTTLNRVLSGAIACALSPKEQIQAAGAQEEALNSGQIGRSSRRGWTSSERPAVNGGSVVKSRSSDNGSSCAVTETFITDENGQEKSVEKELCQGADGKWA